MDELSSWKRFDLHLVRLGHYLRLRDGLLLAQRTLWWPGGVALLVQIVGRIWPIPALGLVTLIPLAAWLVLVSAVALLRPLPAMRVARRVDIEMGLKERVSTALFLAGHEGEQAAFAPQLVSRQQQDALRAVSGIDPRRAFALRWLRRPLYLAAGLLLAAALLAVTPNPMDQVLAERAAVAAAAEAQAERIEELAEEIAAEEMSPEEREELLRQLAELARRLRDNPGDREQALADLSRLEEALRSQIDPNLTARQAAAEALAAQLQALAEEATGQRPADEADALAALAEALAEMDDASREELVRQLAQLAAEAAQAGDAETAQALARLAQAVQTGDQTAASEAARTAAEAMAETDLDLAGQQARQQVLDQLSAGRQAVAQAGQNGSNASQGQSAGQGQTPGQGQSPGQGQGQGQTAGSGGGTKADTLPPATRSGQAGRPQGEGQPGGSGELGQVYVPWDRLPGNGDEVTIPGQDTGQGETQVRERTDPIPGAPDQALVPYQAVYYSYLNAAGQAMEQEYIPPELKDYVREYFSRLEP